MFRSLRTKLVASHVLVIVLAFVLTAAVASVPVRRAQQQRIDQDLRSSAENVARQLDLTRQLAPAGDVLAEEMMVDIARRLVDAERRRSGNRILIVDASGTVLVDTNSANSYEGERLEEIAETLDDIRARFGQGVPDTRPIGRVTMALETASERAAEIDGHRAIVAGTSVSAASNRMPLYVVAISPRAMTPVLDDLLRPLLLAALAGIAVSVLIALLLARAITGPLRQLSANVAAMQASDLDQHIQLDASGEVGTLVDAFNGMLERVAATYRSQRGLLANIAHELRTPLTSIQGYAQALRDGVLTRPEDRDNALEAISDEAGRMTTLVEQILQLSRLESGQAPLVIETVALDETLARLERRFAPLADEREVTLDVGPAGGLEIEADAELLLQALGNLTANAIRHTPPGGSVSLRASRLASAARPAGVRITVSDTGEGIAEEHLEHIFERFYRAGDETGTRSGRNFGLGLAIVREVVDRHGGEISVQSAPGEGTVFTIDLPAKHPGAPPTP